MCTIRDVVPSLVAVYGADRAVRWLVAAGGKDVISHAAIVIEAE